MLPFEACRPSPCWSAESWEHAQARIAARRGGQADAQKRAAAAKAILVKGTIPKQVQFFLT